MLVAPATTKKIATAERIKHQKASCKLIGFNFLRIDTSSSLRPTLADKISLINDHVLTLLELMSQAMMSNLMSNSKSFAMLMITALNKNVSNLRIGNKQP